METIVSVAQRENADLLAIASHGRSGLSRVFYGSVAAGIMQKIDRPMLIIRTRNETISKDLNEIITQRLEHHKSQLKESQISVQTSLDENCCTFHVDVEKIGWVIDQLIGNAIELSSPRGSIQIRSEQSAGHCRIDVQDQGPGIRPEHMQKIFQPFFTTTGKGTGLSLACSKKILDDMGGSIQVASEWGKGATFTLIVPREKQTETFRDKVLAKGKTSSP